MRTRIFLLLASVFLLISCSSESTSEDLIPSEIDGVHTFQIDFTELKAQSTSQKGTENLEPIFALISVKSSNGSSILNRERVNLIHVNGSYSTSEITLKVGNYRLTEFIVVDENDVVLSMVPYESSAMSQFVANTLPIAFEVSENEVNNTLTENLFTAGFTSTDFGYTGLSLEFPEISDFFELHIDQSELQTTKTLTIKSVTGSNFLVDWGDGVVDDYTTSTTDTEEPIELVHIYETAGNYTITINGPIEVIEYFTFMGGEIPNEIYQYQNNLVSVDLTKLKLLKYVGINEGRLSTIDVSGNPVLENLIVFRNNLTSIDLSGNPNLKQIFITENSLTSLDITQNPNLERIYVSENQLTTLDLANNKDLVLISANKNQLSSLDISNNTKLTHVHLGNNLLTNLDTSNNAELISLSVGFNQVTSIDVSNNPLLIFLQINENQISSLDISNNLNLERLDANDNLFTELNISSNEALKSLVIGNNNFQTIDISNNPFLTSLQLTNNQFDNEILNEIISILYNNVVLYSLAEGTMYYSDNPGTESIDSGSITKLGEMVDTYQWKIYGN